MKNNIIVLFAASSLLMSGGAALAEQHMSGHMEHKHVSQNVAESVPVDIKKHANCVHCGMSREKFSYSRMVATYVDGTSVGGCSIHCLSTELKKNMGKTVTLLEVADLNTGKLIHAKKAFWVIGGDKQGVMTKVPKWAFAQKSSAVEFIKKNGGKLATFREALAMAENE